MSFRLLLRNQQPRSDAQKLHEAIIDKSSRPAALQLAHVEVPRHLARRAWKLRLGKTLRRVQAKQQVVARPGAPAENACPGLGESRALPRHAPAQPSALTQTRVAFATIVIWSAVVVLGIFAWRTRSQKAEPSLDSVHTHAESPSK